MAQGLKMTTAALSGMVLIVLMISSLVESKAVITDFGYTCRRSSPQLNDCVREGLTKAIRRFKAGSQELGLPPLDPMEIPFLETRHDDTNLTLDLTMRNVVIQGFSDIVIARVTTNLDDVNKLEVTGRTPALQIHGDYVSEGLIVTFPLHSAGSFTINMTEVTSSWVVYLREMTRNKTAYLQIDGFDIEMMPINITFRPASQLDGDNHLGEAVNEILNENSHEMYSIMKGRLAKVLSGVLTEYTNTVLSQVPESMYLRS